MGFKAGRKFPPEFGAKVRAAKLGKKRPPFSDEWKRKMSIAGKGRVFSDDHKKRLSESLKGKNKGKSHPQTDETKRKISLANKGNQPWLGKKHTDEQKRKMSERTQGSNAPGWKDGRMKDRIYRCLYSRLVMQNRRALGNISSSQWTAIKAKFHFSCPACGKFEPDIKLTIDHIIPVSRDGTNDINNLQPLCGPCNSRKRNIIKRYHSSDSKREIGAI